MLPVSGSQIKRLRGFASDLQLSYKKFKIKEILEERSEEGGIVDLDDFVSLPAGTLLYSDDKNHSGTQVGMAIVARVLGETPGYSRLVAEARDLTGRRVNLSGTQFVSGSLTTHRWCSAQNIDEARATFSGEMLQQIVAALKESPSGLSCQELAAKLGVSERVLGWVIQNEERNPTLHWNPLHGLKTFGQKVFITS